MNFLKLLGFLAILILCLGTFSAESAGPKSRRICCHKMKTAHHKRKINTRSAKRHNCVPCQRSRHPNIPLPVGPLPLN
ncbi:Hypothetical predicted protein [Podarcis lilfordi]|uniref:Uncharacterized protein n=1 Tax=Podarcis lilfordi TaxID=74358 RepID=A0AA35P3Q4_9SAUR|nr:Hypothetical predicted protein [Podarcis lilfordi]